MKYLIVAKKIKAITLVTLTWYHAFWCCVEMDNVLVIYFNLGLDYK